MKTPKNKEVKILEAKLKKHIKRLETQRKQSGAVNLFTDGFIAGLNFSRELLFNDLMFKD